MILASDLRVRRQKLNLRNARGLGGNPVFCLQSETRLRKRFGCVMMSTNRSSNSQINLFPDELLYERCGRSRIQIRTG